MRCALLVAAVMCGAAACGTGSSSVSAGGPAPSPSSSAPSHAKGSARSVDTFLGTITLWGVENPANGTDEANSLRAQGKVFALADVEACSKSGAPFSPQSFALQSSDGRSWPVWNNDRHMGARAPDLAAEMAKSPAAGQCSRGWITFEVDPGVAVTAVTFRPQRSEEVYTLPAS